MPEFQTGSPAAGRILVIEQVFHQLRGEQPSEVASTYNRALREDERPYLRTLKVGLQWQELDCGWVKNPSLILLRNEEGRRERVIPTVEHAAEVAARIIEVTVTPLTEPLFFVRPGESMRVEPVCVLMIRCRAGEARASVAVFPS